jgi:type I restriction enzyme M protein
LTPITLLMAARAPRERRFGLISRGEAEANLLFFDRKPARESQWTTKVWFYDLRTNMHFTLKQNRLARADLDEFVELYIVANRHQRKATWSEKKPEGRWRPYGFDEIIARDKASLDIFWLRDESLDDSANLPDPHVLATEIADDVRASLEQIEDVLADLQARATGPRR